MTEYLLSRVTGKWCTFHQKVPATAQASGSKAVTDILLGGFCRVHANEAGTVTVAGLINKVRCQQLGFN